MDKKLSVPDELQHLIEKRSGAGDRREDGDDSPVVEEESQQERSGTGRRQEDRRES